MIDERNEDSRFTKMVTCCSQSNNPRWQQRDSIATDAYSQWGIFVDGDSTMQRRKREWPITLEPKFLEEETSIMSLLILRGPAS